MDEELHTNERLARAIAEAGLSAEMVALARKGYYHDFLSPLDSPTIQLCDDLAAFGTPPAMHLRERVKEGDFDATAEESEDWMQSEDGVAAITELTRDLLTP